MVGNDLDGEALIGALEHGPDALKEVIPSLGKRLKLIHVLKNIHHKDQQVVLEYRYGHIFTCFVYS